MTDDFLADDPSPAAASGKATSHDAQDPSASQRSLWGFFALSKSSLKIVGVLAAIVAIFIVVTMLVLGVLDARKSYFEARNLRELDRVADSVLATTQMLKAIPDLHFVPAQLRFSRAPRSGCLIASAEIPALDGSAIHLRYDFVDPSNAFAAAKTSGSAAKGADKAETTAVSQAKLSQSCSFAPIPVASAANESTSLDEREISVSKDLVLADLFAPMSRASVEPDDKSLPDCLGAKATPQDSQTFKSTPDLVEKCFTYAATRDLAQADGSSTDAAAPAVVSKSFAAAKASGRIKAVASTGADKLNIEPAFQLFDAVTILGPAPSMDAPGNVLLHIGDVPPLVDEQLEESQSKFVHYLLGASGSPSTSSSGTKQPGSQAQPLLVDASIGRVGDLIVFQKSYAYLGGLGCKHDHPCTIRGIVSAARLEESVRAMRGTEATLFLIGLLTLIASLPLLHLVLRKRLDPIGRTVQYVMWFSLTLLAATAMIASLTAWSHYVSRMAGRDAASRESRYIQREFGKDLTAAIDASLTKVKSLQPTKDTFPLPLPEPDDASNSKVPEFPESLEAFQRDGSYVKGLSRIANVGYPAYGLSIADRPYFRRALAGRYDRAPCLKNGKAEEFRFVLDRVVARPDGTRKTVLLIPAGQPCFPSNAADRMDGEGATQPPFIVAAGYIGSFFKQIAVPGIEYAVVDPKSPRGTPNVIFHSRGDSELIERFQDELGSPGAFEALASRLEKSDPKRDPDPLELATEYHGAPVVLSVSKLDPRAKWLLVMIESRNDASFAIWRAAVFGYSTWLVAMILLFVVMFVGQLGNPKALDRRPGLWMWPREVLEDFTAARSREECAAKILISRAVTLRDRHLLVTGIAGIIGIMATEAVSRAHFAFGAILAAFAARAYFRGSSATDWTASRRLDAASVVLSAAFLLLSLLSFVAAASAIKVGGAGEFYTRAVLYAAALLVMAWVLVGAGRAVFSGRVKEPRSSTRRIPPGWMILLILTGGAPAAAGYLDSVDQDFYLVADHTSTVQDSAIDACDDMIKSASVARGDKVGFFPVHYDRCRRAHEAWVDERKKAGKGECFSSVTSDFTAAGAALTLAGLRERALLHSDQPCFHMMDGFRLSRNRPPRATLAISLFAIPFGLLLLVLIYFRRQYFPRGPRPMAWEKLDLHPPLIWSRQKFIEEVIPQAALNDALALPFGQKAGNHHLILGVDLDIRADIEMSEKEGIRAASERIDWFDLLEFVSNPLRNCGSSAEANLIIIGNLDIALQLPSPDQIERTFETLKKIVESSAGKQIFILAEIEPLDRIALLRNRTTEEGDARLIDDWQWSSLLQDFSLCLVTALVECKLSDELDPVDLERTAAKSTAPEDVATHELEILNLHFAKQLLGELHSNQESSSTPSTDADAEQAPAPEETPLIAYIAEQLADYYHKLWASSGDEERVILYHLAWGRHLKMGDSRAVRSLLTRGLIVRTPEYRLMNDSFARYIRRVERVQLIERRAKRAEGMDQIWPLLRYPLAALVASLVVLLKESAPDSNAGAVALVPALGALIPSLFSNLLRARPAAR